MMAFVKSLCVLLLLSCIAFVQGQPDDATASVMAGFDTNKDGKISLQELKDHVGDNTAFEGWQSGFKQADADKDGHLTAVELSALLESATKKEEEQLVDKGEESIAQTIMDGFDTNKDGVLSFEELEQKVGDQLEQTGAGHGAFHGWQDGFKEADHDKDGVLTVPELADLLHGVKFQDQQELVEESEEATAAQIMDGFDSDKDGKLSLMELIEHIGSDREIQAAFTGWETGFKEADADQDGHLTVQELATLLSHISRDEKEEMVEESEESIAASVMDGFDSNKDGKISLKELMDRVGDNTHVHAAFAGWTAGFKQADADSDGHLTLEEVTTLLKHVSRQDQQDMVHESEAETAAQVMDGFDTDKDGKLSFTELKEHVGDNQELHAAFKGWEDGFKEADHDQDEHLTLEELTALLSQVSRGEQHDLVDKSERSIGENILEGFDADKDGKLTLQELMDHVGDHEHIHAAFEGWQDGFKQADVDQDGYLTAEELTNLITHVSREDQKKMAEKSRAEMMSYIVDGFDNDKNGKLSLEELKKHMSGDSKMHSMFEGWEDGFQESDADNDGHLDSDELQKFLHHSGKNVMSKMKAHGEKSMVTKMMSSYDTDKDGKVSLTEIMAHVKSRPGSDAFHGGWEKGFQTADADNDGFLNEEELASLLNHVSKEHRHQVMQDTDKTAASVLDGFDTDKDGKISMKEMEDRVGSAGFKGWKTGFKEADADSDGHLTAEELSAWFKIISEDMPKHDEM